MTGFIISIYRRNIPDRDSVEWCRENLISLEPWEKLPLGVAHKFQWLHPGALNDYLPTGDLLLQLQYFTFLTSISYNHPNPHRTI
jgi:hypothetical protein